MKLQMQLNKWFQNHKIMKYLEISYLIKLRLKKKNNCNVLVPKLIITCYLSHLFLSIY